MRKECLSSAVFFFLHTILAVYSTCNQDKCIILPNENTKLKCSGAGCTEVYKGKGAETLRNVDLSNNQITEVPLLDYAAALTLNLSNNRINSVADSAFSKCTTLVVLDLSNNLIETIDSIQLAGLHSLTFLDLSFNQLSLLDHATFDFGIIGDLSKLDLSNNRISIIKTTAINDMKSLRSLHLDHNNLTNITSQHFVGLGNLTRAYFNDNKITTIPKEFLYDCTKLMELDLQNNQIASIEPQAFSKLALLEKLNLKRNHLTGLPSGLFSPPNLLDLYLDGNQFTEISPDLFYDCSARKISLIGLDKLKVVKNGSFISAPKVQTLDISHCGQLVHVEVNAFGMNSSRLKALDLSNNRLQFLPASLLNWKIVEKVDLSSNPWHCGCPLEWVLHEDVRLLHSQDTKCATPDYLKEHPVKQLHKDDFRCWKTRNYSSSSRLLSNKAIMLYAAVIVVICLLAVTGVVMIWRRLRRRLTHPPDVTSRYTSLLNAEDGEERTPPVPDRDNIPKEKRKLTDPDPDDV